MANLLGMRPGISGPNLSWETILLPSAFPKKIFFRETLHLREKINRRQGRSLQQRFFPGRLLWA